MKLCVIAERESLGQELEPALRDAGAEALTVEAGSSGELLAAVAAQQPDVVLLDVDLPEPVGDATTLVEPLRALGVKVLLLVDPAERPRLYAAIGAGAEGIVARTVSAQELMAAARQLVDGGTVIGEAIRDEVGAQVHRQRSREEAEPSIHPQLSAREREVLARQRHHL
jgi:DNA-binding NarL/FixJ family response regulator